MSNQSPTDRKMDVTVRTLDWNAEVRKLWGPKWNEPEVQYRFSNGREFKWRTEDGAPYNPNA